MSRTLLAPASLLPHFDERWRAILGQVREPSVLVILSSESAATRRSAERLVAFYRLHGKSVTALPADQVVL